jgi:ATP-dependent RNA helicase DDX56/DBP9
MAKRKLDDNDVPVPVSPAVDAADAADAGPKAESKQKSKAEEGASFQSLGLDSRLLQGIVKLGFKHPTLVQQKAIPLALSGKDVLARAKTGGGKTAAYVLPVVNGILRRKEEGRQVWHFPCPVS